MDFGIARSSASGRSGRASELAPHGHGAYDSLKSAARPDDGRDRSRAPSQYMAPEQARGRRSINAPMSTRSGLIFLGHAARQAPHADAVERVEELKERMEQPPPPGAIARPEDSRSRSSSSSRDVCSPMRRHDSRRRPSSLRRSIASTRRASRSRSSASVTSSVSSRPASRCCWRFSRRYWWYQRQFIPVVTHDPVSVVIADFQNTTSDPDVRQHPRTDAAARVGGSELHHRVRPDEDPADVRRAPRPRQFDEVAARQLAIKQGLGSWSAGSIAPHGSGYDISVQATQPLTGNVVASFTRRASSKDQVLDAVTRVVASVRSALGDETSDSDQLLGDEEHIDDFSGSGQSVCGGSGSPVDGQSSRRRSASYSKAVELDPEFGLGYQGLAVMSRNLGRLQESPKSTRAKRSGISTR